MTTIVYAHPLENSLNGSIKNSLETHLNEKGIAYHMIDLYKDNFSPALTAEERTKFFTGRGESKDPVVIKYQNYLRGTGHLVFIFPIWWNEQPAIVKGFVERTCLPGFAYAYTDKGNKALLTHIKKVTVLTTSGGQTDSLMNRSGNIIENQFIKNMVMPMTWCDDVQWYNLPLSSVGDLEDYVDKAVKRWE